MPYPPPVNLSIKNVFENDSLTVLIGVLVPLGCLFVIGMQFLKAYDERHSPFALEPAQYTPIYGAIIVGVISEAFAWMRLYRMRRIFNTGPRVMAKVERVTTYRRRMWAVIHLRYQYEGREYSRPTTVTKNKRTLAVEEDSTVEVALDPSQPANALILQIYCIEAPSSPAE